MANEQEALIEAVNLIGCYCRDHMPKGWTLRFEFDSDEARVELFDPNDEEPQEWQGDDGEPVSDACNYASYSHHVDEQQRSLVDELHRSVIKEQHQSWLAEQ